MRISAAMLSAWVHRIGRSMADGNAGLSEAWRSFTVEVKRSPGSPGVRLARMMETFRG